MTIPIPIDAAYFQPMTDIPEAKARIVFTGMMNHPPNIDAACFFARDVFPAVRKVIPEGEVLAGGQKSGA